jgi:hypothetical protein
VNGLACDRPKLLTYFSFLGGFLAGVLKISPVLKKRAAQIKLVLMDVDGTMTDGGVTLLSQPDGTAL